MTLRSRSSFYVKVFWTSLFPNPIMYLVHVWYDDRLILVQNLMQYHPHLTIWPLGKGHKHRIFMSSLFPNPMMYLVRVWNDDRDWSKILCSTIPTPVHELKVKVMDLEFLYKSFLLKFLQYMFLCSLWWILFMFGMVIDTGPSASLYMTLRLRSHTYNFYVKVLSWSFYSVSFCNAFNGFDSFLAWW